MDVCTLTEQSFLSVNFLIFLENEVLGCELFVTLQKWNQNLFFSTNEVCNPPIFSIKSLSTIANWYFNKSKRSGSLDFCIVLGMRVYKIFTQEYKASISLTHCSCSRMLPEAVHKTSLKWCGQTWWWYP